MKNAMKKLTSLLLVAVLLVGALPFAASAEEVAVPTVLVHVNNTLVNTVEGEEGKMITLGDCVLAGQINLSNEDVTDASAKKHGGEWVSLMDGGELAMDENAYYYVYVKTEAKSSTVDNIDEEEEDITDEEEDIIDEEEDEDIIDEEEDEDFTDEEDEEEEEETPVAYAMSIDVNGKNVVLTSKTSISYEECLAAAGIDTSKVKVTEAVYQYTQADGRIPNFNFGPGDKIELTADTRIFFFTEAKKDSTSGSNTGSSNKPADKVVDEEWMKDIYLYIYTNNDIITPAKRVLLNNYKIVNDHKLSKAEILSVVDDYYKATNANNGIIWKGAYQETSNITALDFVAGLDYTNNGKAYIDDLDVERSSNNVIIKVRVTGVTGINSAAADTSNPKTGDSIYTAMIVMGVSAASLAAVLYFYNKKRQTV